MFACKKDVTSNTPSLTIVSPNGGEVFRAGQTINVKWDAKNIPSGTLIAAQIVNKQTNKPIVGIALHPTNAVTSSIGDVTANDGEEAYQVPWQYSQDGNMLYKDGISTTTFTIQLVVGAVDGSGIWSIPNGVIIDAVSGHPFTVLPSVLPDGCLTNSGYSITTGQPCR